MTKPIAVIVAGANGAGKTTFARQFVPALHPGVPFLNADEIQRQSSLFATPTAAARELLLRLESAESLFESFAVETTLASRTYLPPAFAAGPEPATPPSCTSSRCLPPISPSIASEAGWRQVGTASLSPTFAGVLPVASHSSMS
jgi:hypothetical protein